MKIAVAGLGLIGGSLYKAAVAAGHDVTGLHYGDVAGLDEADVVFAALPPDAIVPWIVRNSASFRKGAVVIDVCGVKRPVMAAMDGVPKNGWLFIGGHPMAGKEKGGYENSSADLFRGASMILTPPEGTPAETVESLKGLFASLGFAMTVVTTPERHDAMIAFTSQLCHIIASAYARDERVSGAIGFSAGSYANMTRIATMDPETWSSLFLSDADGLLEVLDGFIARLGEYRDAIAARDENRLKALILAGADAKRRELKAREGSA